MRISDWSSDVCSSDLLAKHNIEGIQRRKAHIVRLQYLQAFLLPTHTSIALKQISRHETGVFRSSRQDRLEIAALAFGLIAQPGQMRAQDRKSTRLNSSH